MRQGREGGCTLWTSLFRDHERDLLAMFSTARRRMGRESSRAVDRYRRSSHIFLLRYCIGSSCHRQFSTLSSAPPVPPSSLPFIHLLYTTFFIIITYSCHAYSTYFLLILLNTSSLRLE